MPTRIGWAMSKDTEQGDLNEYPDRASRIIKFCLDTVGQAKLPPPDVHRVLEHLKLHVESKSDDVSRARAKSINLLLVMMSFEDDPARIKSEKAMLLCLISDQWKRANDITTSDPEQVPDDVKKHTRLIEPVLMAARECDANTREDRILPIIKSDNQLPDLQPQAPLQGDLFIPAIETGRMPYALPLQWFAVGFKNHDLRGRSTPVEQRLIIELLLATAKHMRDGVSTPVRFERQYLFSRLFGDRAKQVGRVWERVMEAFMRLSTAGISRGDGHLYFPFHLQIAPEPDNPHGEFVCSVNVPDGDGNGPKVPENLHKIALRSAVQYRLLLNSRP